MAKKRKSVVEEALDDFANSSSGGESIVKGIVYILVILPLWLFFGILEFIFNIFMSNSKKEKKKSSDLSLSETESKKNPQSEQPDESVKKPENKKDKKPPKLYTGAI